MSSFIQPCPFSSGASRTVNAGVFLETHGVLPRNVLLNRGVSVAIVGDLKSGDDSTE